MSDDPRLDDLLLLWEERLHAGEPARAIDLCADCPELIPELERRITALKSLAWLENPAAVTPSNDHLTLLPGTELVPGYRLTQRLGRGGFGEVWEATAPGERLAALKFLPQDHRPAQAEERGLAAMLDVRHPHLLSVYATWQRDGFFIIAMERADKTLFDRLQECSRAGQAGIPRDELLRYLREAAEALDHLNERCDIQHRDVKPQNLLLCGGSVKVGDFGLARLLVHAITGHTGGFTLAYAPPEFFRAQTSRSSDQYSLAASYCLLRGGKLPFTGSVAEQTHGHLHCPPDLSMLPVGERPAVAKALAKKPADRWPSCQAFVEAVASETPAHLDRRKWLKVGAAAAAAVGCPLLFRSCLAPASLDISPPPSGPRPVFEFSAEGIGGFRHLAAMKNTVAKEKPYWALTSGHTGVDLWNLEKRSHLGTLTTQRAVGCDFASSQRPWAVAALDEDDEILLWDLDAQKLLQRFRGHTASVSSVLFSSDNQFLVSAATDKTVRVWDRLTGKEVQRFECASYQMRAVFTPSGRQVLSAGFDGLLRVWDVASGQLVRSMETPNAQIWAMDLHPNEMLAVTGGQDKLLRLWDVNTGALVRTFAGHEGMIKSVSLFVDVTAPFRPLVRLRGRRRHRPRLELAIR